MSFDIEKSMTNVLGNMKSVVESCKVIGEPVVAGEKTIIPVTIVRLGFGMGAGSGSEKETGGGSGGGGGGGLTMTPCFLIVDKDGERIATLPSGSTGGITEVISNLFNRAKRQREDTGSGI
jgi:uncharacterized spore protein YtfJ